MLTDSLHALIAKWEGEAAEIEADGYFCCAETRRQDARMLALLLEGVERPQGGEEQKDPKDTKDQGYAR